MREVGKGRGHCAAELGEERGKERRKLRSYVRQEADRHEGPPLEKQSRIGAIVGLGLDDALNESGDDEVLRGELCAGPVRL